MRVKICGLTDAAAVTAAAEAGAAYVGFVFFPPSPRALGFEKAAEIAAATPAGITRVGLTVDFAPLEAGTWRDLEGGEGEIALAECDRECKPGFVGQLEAFTRLVAGGEREWPLLRLQEAHETIELARHLAESVVDRPEYSAS